MNPFDLRAAVFAPHAQHVVLIHFPIALFIAGVAFDWMALWKGSRTLIAAAYYNLLGAALTSVPAITTGLLAWHFQLGGARLKGNLLLHLVLALVSSAGIWLVWWQHFRARSADRQGASKIGVAAEIAAVFLVALTGHVGGFLSGVNGPG
jgi:uncharacterized membrane protein